MTVALLDANVLYPAALRDLLLWLAAEEVYSPISPLRHSPLSKSNPSIPTSFCVGY